MALKIGMTLLVNDDSFDIVMPNVLWNSKVFDQIVCVADRPGRMLEVVLRDLERQVPNFKYLGPSVPFINFPDDHPLLINPMIQELTNMGMEWVLNLDDDEFLVGDHVRDSIERTASAGLNALYTHGHVFYEVQTDVRDANPVRRMVHRDPDGTDFRSKKVIHKTADFLTTTSGNHFIQYRSTPVLPGFDPSLLIYHYCIRLKRYDYKSRKLHRDTLSEEGAKEIGLAVDRSLIELFDKFGIPV